MTTEITTTDTVVQRGEQLGADDVDVFFEVSGVAKDPYSLLFDIYNNTTGTAVLIPPANRVPNKIATGHYYAPWYAGADADFGEYLVVWKYRLNVGDPENTEETNFFVVADKGTDYTYDDDEQYFITQLRYLLRDFRPDDYHFLPPIDEAELKAYSTTNKYLWYDEQLIRCANWGLSEINNLPPRRADFTLSNIRSDTRYQRMEPLLLQRAACFAIDMMSMYWTAEGFSYSINGVSLDIDKASMYRDMKDMFWNQFIEGVEQYQRTVKITKGLKHSYYRVSPALGARGLVGPYTSGKNIANYIKR